MIMSLWHISWCTTTPFHCCATVQSLPCSPENYETWIRNVKCGEGEDHPQNLLRCTYDLYKGDSEHCGHDMDLVVECSETYIDFKYRGAL